MCGFLKGGSSQCMFQKVVCLDADEFVKSWLNFEKSSLFLDLPSFVEVKILTDKFSPKKDLNSSKKVQS